MLAIYVFASILLENISTIDFFVGTGDPKQCCILTPTIALGLQSSMFLHWFLFLPSMSCLLT